MPDQCGNEAFFGLTDLQTDESLLLKPAYGALQKAWAGDPPDACALPPAPPSSPAQSGAASAASTSLAIGLSAAGALVALLKGR